MARLVVHFWTDLIRRSPATFAAATARAETAICLCLLLGILQRPGWAFGVGYSLLF